MILKGLDYLDYFASHAIGFGITICSAFGIQVNKEDLFARLGQSHAEICAGRAFANAAFLV